MKSKILFLTLTFALLLSDIIAQQNDTLILDISGRSYSEKVFYFIQNNENVPLSLSWKLEENTMKETWDVEFCDCGSCFVNTFPDSLVCPDIPVGESNVFSFRVNPNDDPEVALFKIGLTKTSNGTIEKNSVSVITRISTSASDLENQNHVKIFPTVLNNLMYIDMTPIVNSNAYLKIYDLNGRLVLNTNIQAGGVNVIEMSNQVAGIYLIEISGDFETINRKIQKIN